ncbi:MAG: YraN family protein, partial [Chloroflexi bacterium]|nr:YraN family protein [Chloroflexota bacterium]
RPPTPRQGLGAMGERLVAEHLRRQGYEIVETNFRCSIGEIDIVARRGGWLVFVEVRTRRGGSFGTPEESITAAKARKLRDLAATYLEAHPEAPLDWRIDVAAVELTPDGRLLRLEIVEHAVEAE